MLYAINLSASAISSSARALAAFSLSAIAVMYALIFGSVPEGRTAIQEPSGVRIR